MKKLFFILIFNAFHLSVFAQYNWFADTTNFDVNCAKPGQRVQMAIHFDLDKTQIRDDSKIIMDSFINLMKIRLFV